MTTKQQIELWLKDEQKKNITHMLVVCDTFDYEDYPVYVSKKEKVRKVYAKYNGPNMQIVMEVYSYKKNIHEQLSEQRSFHFD
jgi:hypothetical protein